MPDFCRSLLPRFALWPLLAAMLCAGCEASPRPPFSSDRVARFERALDEMHRDQFAVASLVAVDDGVHRYEGVRGLADRDEARAMTSTTPFRTASLGKTFTGALVLSLHEEGALSVDDPVSDYLPDFPHGDAITLRMLLTHTSGVANYTHVSAWVDAASRGAPLTEREVVALCAASELDFPPGTAWNYSNTGYLVLGMIVEQLVGRTVTQELEARFFVPLGMSGTVPFAEAPPDLARGYERDGEPSEWDPAFVYPTDGGWVTTASDLMIWSRAFFGGALHSEATLALARRPEGGELLTSVAESFGLTSGGYALGFLAAEDATLGTLYAGAGNGAGVRTFVGFLPEQDLAFATFVDVGDGSVPIVETLSATRPMLDALREDAQR